MFNKNTVLLQESAVAEQGLGVGLLATEVDIHVHGIVDAAGGEHILAEAIGYVLVEDVARLLECLKSVGLKHLGPHITIISGSVAATHGVVEISGAIAGRNLREKSALHECLTLEILYVEVVGH